MLDASSIEEGLRASAREMAQYAPGSTRGGRACTWSSGAPRIAAARAPAKVAEQHERLLGTVSGLVAVASRWGVEFTLPAREVVRGVYAISRGLGLEALLADDTGTPDPFEEMFLAYVMGLIRARPGTGAPGRGGLHDHDHLDLDLVQPGGPAQALAGAQLSRDGFVRRAARVPGRAAAGAGRPRRGRLALVPGGAGAGCGLGRRAAAGAADAVQDDDDGQLRPDRHRPPASPGGPGGAHLRRSGRAASRPWGGTRCSPPAPPGCAGCSWRTSTSSPSGSGPACGAWPAGGWGRRPGWPGSVPPARGTSPTRSTPCCWPGGPVPPKGLAVTTPLPEMVAALNALQPEALTAYPSMAAMLAEEQVQGRLRSRRRWSAPARRCRRPTCASAWPTPGGWCR